jgi:hypothetical protein
LATTAYAVAEEMILTTYYPSPRGVHREARIGTGNALSPGASLEVSSNGGLALQVAQGLVVDASGNVGVGTVAPQRPLTVVGQSLFGGLVTVNPGIGGGAAQIELSNGAAGYSLLFGGTTLDLTSGSGSTAISLAMDGTATINRLIVQTQAEFLGPVNPNDPNSAPAEGKVLSSDATGLVRWEYPRYAP